jgi:hypothetical protein
VNLTTKQVETLFGELEYLEPKLNALSMIVVGEADYAEAIQSSGGTIVIQL